MKIIARILSGEIVEVEFNQGYFTSIKPKKIEILDLPWIAPGLIDIQVNGFGGVDFNRAMPSPDDWRQATGELYRNGCTGFLIALITNTEEGYRERLKELTAHIRRDPAQLPRLSYGRSMAESRSRLSRRASIGMDE